MVLLVVINWTNSNIDLDRESVAAELDGDTKYSEYIEEIFETRAIEVQQLDAYERYLCHQIVALVSAINYNLHGFVKNRTWIDFSLTIILDQKSETV